MNKLKSEEKNGVNFPMKMPDVIEEYEKGKWRPATPEPYYPSLVEKIRHLLGVCIYPEYDEKTPHGVPQCLICYKYK